MFMRFSIPVNYSLNSTTLFSQSYKCYKVINLLSYVIQVDCKIE